MLFQEFRTNIGFHRQVRLDVLVELQGYYELSRIGATLPWIAAKFPSR